jgi:hypothetical protein
MLVRAALSGRALQAEAARLAAHTPIPDIQANVHGILADYQARCTEQVGAHLEGDAKGRKDFESLESIPPYQALLAADPANEEGMFDLGQTLGALKRTRHELEEYARLLDANPLHRDAQVALERAGLELGPQLITNPFFFSQNGRDGLARINTLLLPVSILVPWGDEDEFFQLGYARIRYMPHDDARSTATSSPSAPRKSAVTSGCCCSGASATSSIKTVSTAGPRSTPADNTTSAIAFRAGLGPSWKTSPRTARRCVRTSTGSAGTCGATCGPRASGSSAASRAWPIIPT